MRRHDERRAYRVATAGEHPVHRTVQRRVVERHAPRVIYRTVERHHYRPARRQVAHSAPLAQAVYYYDGTLVGRDPDANVRLMLLRDNARTLWAR